MRSDPPDSLSSQARSVPVAGHPTASPDRLAFVADTLRALGVLTSVQREVLTLSYFAELTQDEVADRLGIPGGSRAYVCSGGAQSDGRDDAIEARAQPRRWLLEE